MLASNKGYTDIVDILIKKGANVNAQVKFSAVNSLIFMSMSAVSAAPLS